MALIGGVIVGGDALLASCEKETMQNLNICLAVYLNKVGALKEANTNLEFKIKGWHNKQEPGSDHDYSPYFRTIEDLRNKILSATVDNANLILWADNARLTSEDFKSKFEVEQALRIYVEADICSLYKVLDEVAQARVHLERQLQLLTEELLQLKKKHKEEMRSLQNQMGREITVEIDATPGIDLTKTLAEKHEKCESLIEKNRKDIEQWFINKISFLWTEELNQQVTRNTEEFQCGKLEVIDLRHTLQGL